MVYLIYYAATIPGMVAAGLILATFVLLGLETDAEVLMAGFLGTFAFYQWDRLPGRSPADAINFPDRVKGVEIHLKLHRFLMIASAAFAVFAASGLPLLSLAAAAFVGVLAAVHATTGRALFRVTEKLPLKALVIAAGWAVGSVLVPATQASAHVPALIGVVLLYRFVFLLPNLLLSDWIDAEGESLTGAKSTLRDYSRNQILRGCAFLVGLAVLVALTAVALGVTKWVLIDAVGAVVAFGIVKQNLVTKRRHYALLDVAAAWPGLIYLGAVTLP